LLFVIALALLGLFYIGDEAFLFMLNENVKIKIINRANLKNHLNHGITSKLYSAN